jgi:SAM-dependent methyltransferase
LLGNPGATYKQAIEVLSPDAEGTYFVYRFSDPTFLMAQTVIEGVSQCRPTVSGRVIDLCGGSGHLTRVIESCRPAGGTVLADVFFFKLWLAKRFTAPSCQPVCCDGNNPLPFDRDTFSMVVLSDAFPYIWHKRLLAGEMMRVAGPRGTIVMPHLHSALGENFSAGMTLTPAAYRDLFEPHHPRLFRDSTLLTDAIDRGAVDLSQDTPAATLGGEPSLTLVASPYADVFRRHEPLQNVEVVFGELRVNPLYRVERSGTGSLLTLAFPTPEYEEEFQESRRYLPDTVSLPVDASGPLSPQGLGTDYPELRRRRVVIDAPRRYC